jgi:hypothetical protein
MKSGDNFFIDIQAMRTVDRIRVIYFLIAVLFFFLTELGRKVYRPFIYRNSIDDYGIADSVGNSGGIIVQIFVALAILNAPGAKAFRIVGFMVAGYILYEILQPYLPRGVFDWKDIYGTLIGGVLSVILLLLIKKVFINKVFFSLNQ